MLKTREGSPDGRNICTYREGEEYELPADPSPGPDLGLVMIQEKWAVEVKQVDADSICSEPVKAETAADSDGARRPEPIEFK
jgi:hypothetical protein